MLGRLSERCRDWLTWQPSARRPVPPHTVAEISSDFLSLARCAGKPPRVVAFSARDVPPGMVEPSPSRPHIRDGERLRGLLRSMMEEIDAEPGECALVIPDAAVRVGVLAIESLPRKRNELEPYLLWRMKESLPFNTRKVRHTG